jgi:peptide/nickel transport system permease protein
MRVILFGRRWSRSAVIGSSVLLLLLSVAMLARVLAPSDPFAIAGEALRPPSGAFVFGTDDLGRDVFAGVVHGAANSLQVGLVGALSALLFGVLVGGIAGMRGGLTDDLLMRATEFVQAMPRFFLIITIVSFFGGRLWLIALVIALTSWPDTARVCRVQIQSLLSRDFVVASRAAGCSDPMILVRHILPLTISIIAAHASYQAGGAILTEAALSFLGLGDPRVMSWGTLLGSAQYLVREGWWVSVFPGLAITATVLGSNLLADSLLTDGYTDANRQP